MGTLILRPKANFPYGRGSWSAVGAASLVAAVNESVANDSTYIKLASNYSGTPGYGASQKFTMQTQQLPPGAKVEWMQPSARGKTTNAATEQYVRLLAQNIQQGPNGTNWTAFGSQLKLTTSFAQIDGIKDVKTVSGGISRNGGVIDQNVIDALVVEVYNVENTVIQISQMFITISYDEKPTVAIDAPGTITDTTTPTITWAYSDDKMPQAGFDIVVTDSGGSIVVSETVNSSQNFYQVPVSLPNDTYRIKLRVRQAWTYTGDAPVSDFVYATMIVDLEPLPSPVFDTTPDNSTASVEITTSATFNLLDEIVGEFETPGWSDTHNVIDLYDGRVLNDLPDSGDTFLGVTINNTDTYSSVTSTRYVPVTIAQNYVFSVKALVATGDTAATVIAGINWYNASHSFISASTGTGVTDSRSTWKQAYVSAAAPANAAYARPYVRINGGVLGDIHQLDSAMFTIGTSPVAWSKGGFFSTSTTQNLLSYGNSTFESASFWRGPVSNSLALPTVVNELTENNFYPYQGDYALKLATDTTLATTARRDNQTAVNAASTTVVISKGAVVDQDFMLAIIRGIQTTITPPSGWTLLGTYDDSTTVRAWVYYKFATGSEPSTYTWTLGASGKCAGLITCYQGIDSSSPFSDFTGISAPSSGTVFTMPSVNVSHNNILIHALVGAKAASATATTFTTSISGANKDAQLNTTANTANEVAMGVFSSVQNTYNAAYTAVSGKTITASLTVADAALISIALNPVHYNIEASLDQYQFFSASTDDDFVLSAAGTGGVANSANRTWRLYLDLYDENKSLITSTSSSGTMGTDGIFHTIGSVRVLSDNPLIKYGSLRLSVEQVTYNEVYYFDTISVYRGSVNLGYQPGYRAVDGPYTELEYKDEAPYSNEWKSLTILSALPEGNSYVDREVAKNVTRSYRAYNWIEIDDSRIQSDYYTREIGDPDPTIETLTFKSIWIHSIDDPGGTYHKFFFDGSGNRTDDYGKDNALLVFTGREYPQAQFGSSSQRTVTGTIQMNTNDSTDFEALDALNRSRSLVLYRDGRGRRVKGLLSVSFSDQPWGKVASFTITAAGTQPG